MPDFLVNAGIVFIIIKYWIIKRYIASVVTERGSLWKQLYR